MITLGGRNMLCCLDMGIIARMMDSRASDASQFVRDGMQRCRIEISFGLDK